MFFRETATLIDLMLAGHWIEMRSVMRASEALQEVARLMPNTAHRLTECGVTEEVAIANLRPPALGLAIPLVVSVSTGLGAQRGLLIRDRGAFEEAGIWTQLFSTKRER